MMAEGAERVNLGELALAIGKCAQVEMGSGVACCHTGPDLSLGVAGYGEVPH